MAIFFELINIEDLIKNMNKAWKGLEAAEKEKNDYLSKELARLRILDNGNFYADGDLISFVTFEDFDQ